MEIQPTKKTKRVRRLMNINVAKDVFAVGGCILLATEYTAANTKMPYECRCGTLSSASVMGFEASKGFCIVCDHNAKYQALNKICLDNQCTLLTTRGEFNGDNGTCKFTCGCGNNHECGIYTFKKAKKCLKCSIANRAENCKKWTNETLREYLASHGCTLTSETYTNGGYLEYTCSCGGHGRTKLTHFKNGIRCNECRTARTKQTCIKKYGVDSPMKTQQIKQKICDTNIEKYGVENVFQSDIIKDRIKQDNLEKYGVEYNSQREDVKQLIISANLEKYGFTHACKHPDVKNKIQATNLERYGNICSAQGIETIQKIKQSNLNAYGVEFAFQRVDVKKKIVSTTLERYGDTCALRNADVMAKSKQTIMDRYGVDNVMHSNVVRRKQLSSAFSVKDWTSPNGRIFRGQGYEIPAIQILIDSGIEENDIMTEEDLMNAGVMPEFKYEYDGKLRRYYPDIFIKSQNKFVEVKSMWTFELHRDQVIAKAECVAGDGYGMEIMILDAKKNIVNHIIY